METDVLIIGAGPAGSVAAALLQQQGYQTLIVEKTQFPRFVIGESLLPQCMDIIEEAGLLDQIQSANFQHKNGAAFYWNQRYQDFDFSEKSSQGWDATYQVERAEFDHLLAQGAEQKGAKIEYQTEVIAVDFSQSKAKVSVQTSDRSVIEVTADFVLDASGFGRVLSRLLNLEKPSHFPPRTALFTHIADHIDASDYDRHKILVTIHPRNRNIWYWLIPFVNGRCSVGVVFDQTSNEMPLQQWIAEDSKLNNLLKNAVFDRPIQKINGYACNVSQLSGKNFALLGNAGEFLDPVFSSGVTIALKSASLAANLVHQQLSGHQVNWQQDYDQTLKQGVDCFRHLVDSWYNHKLQNIIFNEYQPEATKKMICSLLAGYAWDQTNPYVINGQRYINLLAELCE